MLEQLKLSNLALSNQAEVDFTPGMICITGETGAGKSLVVDALSLVLGAKADANLVRQGQKQMEVSALFSIDPNSKVHRLLENYGFAEERTRARRGSSQALDLNMPHAEPSFSESAALPIANADESEPSLEALGQAIEQQAPHHEVKVVNGTTVLATANTVISQPCGVSLAQSAIVADGQAVGLPESTHAPLKAVSTFTHVLSQADKQALSASHNSDSDSASNSESNPDTKPNPEVKADTGDHVKADTGANANADAGANANADAAAIGAGNETKTQSVAQAQNQAQAQVQTLTLVQAQSAEANAKAEAQGEVQGESQVAAQSGASADKVTLAVEGMDGFVAKGVAGAGGGAGAVAGDGVNASLPGAENLEDAASDLTESAQESESLPQSASLAANLQFNHERERDNADAAWDGSADDEDNALILRRVVSAEGKSKAYVNGHMATLSQLREISEYLVAIHGQHASVRLMDEKQQLEIVDNFGKLKDLVGKVNQAYTKYSSLRQNLTQLSEAQKIGAIEYKQDRYELEELKRLALNEGDYEELEARFDKAMHQAQFMYAVTNLFNLIEGGDSNITTMLRERQSELDKVKAYDPGLNPLIDHLDGVLDSLHECSAMAEGLMAQDVELSTAELEERMSKVHELSRRFACAPQDLYLMTERLEQKVEKFLSLKDQINALTQEVKDSRQAYEQLCNELTTRRQQVASELAQQIGSRIKDLSLPDARFDIVLNRDDEGRPRLNGRDNLCFMFSANLGQDLKPLSAVASGGELSRLALIIEVLTASVKSTPTLIFDEVDTGISGRTASAVGALLKELGQYVQVITVTHLPQVAAKAHTQFVVAKYNEDGQVNSTISLLDGPGRIEEISRMIGGSVITDTTRRSAYELLHDL